MPDDSKIHSTIINFKINELTNLIKEYLRDESVYEGVSFASECNKISVERERYVLGLTADLHKFTKDEIDKIITERMTSEDMHEYNRLMSEFNKIQIKLNNLREGR